MKVKFPKRQTAWAVRLKSGHLAGRFYFDQIPHMSHSGCKTALFETRDDARFAAKEENEKFPNCCYLEPVKVTVFIQPCIEKKVKSADSVGEGAGGDTATTGGGSVNTFNVGTSHPATV